MCNDLRGGDNEIRTHDPLLARQVLSQLSYTPNFLNPFAVQTCVYTCFSLPLWAKKTEQCKFRSEM